MGKTPEQLRANFKARHGYEYGKGGPSIQECNALAGKLKESTTAVTPQQAQAVRKSLGKDYLTMVDKYQAEHKCTKTDAMMALLKTREGQAARLDLVKATNPESADDLFELADEQPAADKPYSGPDYMELIEARRDKTGCGFVDAALWVMKKHPGAREAHIRKTNPHLQ
jgi:hypothetical protein